MNKLQYLFLISFCLVLSACGSFGEVQKGVINDQSEFVRGPDDRTIVHKSTLQKDRDQETSSTGSVYAPASRNISASSSAPAVTSAPKGQPPVSNFYAHSSSASVSSGSYAAPGQVWNRTQGGGSVPGNTIDSSGQVMVHKPDGAYVLGGKIDSSGQIWNRKPDGAVVLGDKIDHGQVWKRTAGGGSVPGDKIDAGGQIWKRTPGGGYVPGDKIDPNGQVWKRTAGGGYVLGDKLPSGTASALAHMGGH